METKNYLENLTEAAWLSIPRRTHAIYDRLYKYGQQCFNLGAQAASDFSLKWHDIATIITMWEEGLQSGEYTNTSDDPELMIKQAMSILEKYNKLHKWPEK